MKHRSALVALALLFVPGGLTACDPPPLIVGGDLTGGAEDGATVSAPAGTTVLSGLVRLDALTVPAGATVRLDPDRNTTLELTGNLIVEGRLEMRPAAPGITHTVRFVGIDEDAVVGGGMDPVPTDVGLWVMGAGVLDLAGTPKTAWTNAAGDLAAGATTIELAEAPVGWHANDVLVVAPTAPGDSSGFDSARVVSVAGRTVVLDRPLTRDHPTVGARWTAEILNLSRNVRIEGTGDGSLDPERNGRAHVFIHSTKPQSLRYVRIAHVGPRPSHISTRRPIPAEQKFPSPMDTTGRYGLHFHHSGDGSVGSLVEGVVVRDSGNHAFVPHMSNGITFRDTISWNTAHDAYWWDGPTCPPPCNLANHRDYAREGDISEHIVFDHAIAARVKSGSDVARLSGFELGRGAGNVVRNSVVVGVQHALQSNGFEWPEGRDNIWRFTNNLAHNNAVNGAMVWQNTDKPHVIEGFSAYHNVVGIHHGAYTNDFLVRGGELRGNSRAGILLDAVSKTSASLRFEDLVIASGGVGRSAVETRAHRASRSDPTIFRGVEMRGFRQGQAVLFNTTGVYTDRIDIIDPTFGGRRFWVAALPTGSRVRVQESGRAYELLPTRQPGAVWVPEWNAYRRAIAPFAE